MKWKSPLFLMLCWSSLVCWISQAATFYVHANNKNASDNNPGTIDQPLKTIQKAVSLAKAGDVIRIGSGVYREKIHITQSGTPDQPIQLIAEPGGHVVVTGADVLNQLTRDPQNPELFIVDWPHRFITWTKTMTHPDDRRHLLIGRSEQVFINGYLLRQVLDKSQLARGTFFVDTENKKLYLWGYAGENLLAEWGAPLAEASVRPIILNIEGSYIKIRGIRFRYAANRAQEGAIYITGDYVTLEDCIMEWMNSSGATFKGKYITVRRCIFRNNGQLGFGAGYAHNLFLSECIIEHNNIKHFSRGWEAGAMKIAFSRNVVFERCQVINNRGCGIWFDIGNEKNTVRNCFIADNEGAGIFYEISYSLHAHDNVIIGNGFFHDPGAWGVNGGISLSSSPECIVERNILMANREGIQFREQDRMTPRIDQREPAVPIWNHHNIIRNNWIAWNQDYQLGGWFDQLDKSHWPPALQKIAWEKQGKTQVDIAAEYKAKNRVPKPGLTNPTLKDLALTIENNLFSRNLPSQQLVLWGPTWQYHKVYQSFSEMIQDLNLGQGCKENNTLSIQDFFTRDFRVPANSEVIKMGCYPKGEVPGVKLGILP